MEQISQSEISHLITAYQQKIAEKRAKFEEEIRPLQERIEQLESLKKLAKPDDTVLIYATQLFEQFNYRNEVEKLILNSDTPLNVSDICNAIERNNPLLGRGRDSLEKTVSSAVHYLLKERKSVIREKYQGVWHYEKSKIRIR